MSRRHKFLTPDGLPHPRWKEAFDGLEVMTSASRTDGIEKDMTVWVCTTLPDWEGDVRRLSTAGARVVVLSTSPQPGEAMRVFRSGARGYAHACSTPDLLRNIASVVATGGLWLSPPVMRRLAALSGRLSMVGGGEDLDLLLASLTEREREVAQAVAEGKSNKEIARDLGIVERTVKAHLASVFEKFAVRDRLHLALRLATATDDKLPL